MATVADRLEKPWTAVPKKIPSNTPEEKNTPFTLQNHVLVGKKRTFCNLLDFWTVGP
jgi:hypothetical protein